MKRIAFKMQLNEGQKEEYQKRHDGIWPEMKQLLKESGIYEYSIFLDEGTNTLFCFHKIKPKSDLQDLSEKEIIKKWWDYMADIMEVNRDNSPKIEKLTEVFYLK